MTQTNIENEVSERPPLGTAIFGFSLILLGAVILYFSKDIRSFALGENDPGPKALPMICGGIFLMGGIAQLVQAVTVDGLFKKIALNWNGVPVQFVGTLGLLIAYVALLNLLGYLISTSLFMICLLKLFQSRWVEAIVSTTVLVGFVYLLFQLVFKVSLPDGTLF